MMDAVTTIGFVGFGEVASRFAAALQAAGATVVAYDVLLDRAGGMESLAARAKGEPPRFLPLARMIAAADIVLSTVTTDVALAAARSCAAHLGVRNTFVDLNATSPRLKREIAGVIAASGAEFVEGAILPAVNVMGAKSQVLLCGKKAEPVAATMTGLGLNFSAYGVEIGKASSFKMLRSVFSKGMEALLVECLLAGRRAGVESDLWREIVATLDAASFEEVGGNWVRTHATAHARRHHEMVQVEALLREMGVDAPMTAGTVALFERSGRVGLKDRLATAPASAAEVIAVLDTALAGTVPQS
jgi:3-hydroxyisobutyrate dehydrogenase-like beta-hydroxyacid dehydrogenase